MNYHVFCFFSQKLNGETRDNEKAFRNHFYNVRQIEDDNNGWFFIFSPLLLISCMRSFSGEEY